MYPEINALVDELHARRISSFLVTNAQFPDAIRNVGAGTGVRCAGIGVRCDHVPLRVCVNVCVHVYVHVCVRMYVHVCACALHQPVLWPCSPSAHSVCFKS